ncbi:diguanylate cyclase [Aliarcobacter lanthieri]|uniref:sensor domain-containing diguanylate cyclase n=1 Tax=Aliarcobacter lanthieri TaxID=1355374 RepID=UPI003AAE0065
MFKRFVSFELIKSYKFEWILLIISLVLLGLIILWSIIAEIENISKREEDRLLTQARIIDNSISLIINSLNEVFIYTQDRINQGMLNNKDELIHEFKFFTRAVPIARTFAIINKDGKLIVSNREELVGFDSTNRDYFTIIKNNQIKNRLYISSPYVTSLGTWTITLSMMLEDKNGNFDGAMIATINPIMIKQILDSVSYSKDMRTSIISADGTLFLTTPNFDEILGTNIKQEGSLFSQYLTRNEKSSILNGKTYISNINRLVGFLKLKPEYIDINEPIYVAISRDIDILYESFEEEISIYIFLYFILSIVLIPILYILQKRRYKLKLDEIETDRILKEKLEAFAYIDGLTEIPNRRHFDQVFEKEWEYCLRNNKTLCTILIDIDFFKKYNDFYGHQVGDECLKKVAQTLKNSLNRSHDFVARYGGEEFVVILPDTNFEGAIKIAEILRNSIKELNIPHKNSDVSNVVTISLGLSFVIPNNDITPEILLRRSDESLYQSKNTGRDKVSSLSL